MDHPAPVHQGVGTQQHCRRPTHLGGHLRIRGTRQAHRAGASRGRACDRSRPGSPSRPSRSTTERGRQDAADDNIDLELRRGSDRRLVQCKRWTAKWVGVVETRGFTGALAAEKLAPSPGIFVTRSEAERRLHDAEEAFRFGRIDAVCDHAREALSMVVADAGWRVGRLPSPGDSLSEVLAHLDSYRDIAEVGQFVMLIDILLLSPDLDARKLRRIIQLIRTVAELISQPT